MNNSPNDILALKQEVKNLLEMIDDCGIIEETGQTYHKISLNIIFDKDIKMFYNILDKLKKLSE